MATAPARLREAAALAEARALPPGEWTAQQVVLHLVAVELQVFRARLLDLSGPAEPRWTWVEPGPAEPAPGESLDGSVDRFTAARSATLETVERHDDAGWKKTGLHATLGRLDVAGLLALAADHDDEHIAGLLERGHRAGH